MQVRVVESVGSDDVALCVYSAQDLLIPSNVKPKREEGCLYIQLLECIKEFAGVRARAIVEGQRDSLLTMAAVPDLCFIVLNAIPTISRAGLARLVSITNVVTTEWRALLGGGDADG